VNEEALSYWGLLHKINKQTNILFISAVGLVFITWFLIVSMVIIITAFLYWRCYCFLSSGSLIRAVNIQLSAGARRKVLIWEGGLTIRIFVVCVEFKYYTAKLCRYCNCNIGLFATAFRRKSPIMGRFFKNRY
jgi:hypothetical protein